MQSRTPLLLSVLQCADALNLSHWTVRRLVKSGKLPAVRIGSRVLIKASDIAAFVEQHSAAAHTERDAPSFAADEDDS